VTCYATDGQGHALRKIADQIPLHGETPQAFTVEPADGQNARAVFEHCDCAHVAPRGRMMLKRFIPMICIGATAVLAVVMPLDAQQPQPAPAVPALAELVKKESEPPLADLRRAIDAKSSDGFAKAFGRLTQACNRCHQEAGVGFIVIRVPTASPFSNQLFPPTETR